MFRPTLTIIAMAAAFEFRPQRMNAVSLKGHPSMFL